MDPITDHMLSVLRGRDDKLCTDAADEIARLVALLAEVRGDINDYGFSDCFAAEAHITIAKINAVIGGDA
jgi:hypothetical protein